MKRKFTYQFIFWQNTFRQHSLSRLPGANVTWWSHCCNSSISFSKWMTPSTCTNLILRICRSTNHTTTCYLMDNEYVTTHCHGDCRSHNLLDQFYNSDQFYSTHRIHSNVRISRVYSAVIGKSNTSYMVVQPLLSNLVFSLSIYKAHYTDPQEQSDLQGDNKHFTLYGCYIFVKLISMNVQMRSLQLCPTTHLKSGYL